MLRRLFCCLAAFIATPAVAQTQYSSNGHFYQYVTGSFTQAAALADAATRSFGGQQGYLVTITSAGEQAFVRTLIGSDTAWTSGSDAAVEGTWAWTTGPESGTAYYIGSTCQTYCSWNSGEPNGGATRDGMTVGMAAGGWNDTQESSVFGYVVEFDPGTAPEPLGWAMMLGGFALTGCMVRKRRGMSHSMARA